MHRAHLISALVLSGTLACGGSDGGSSGIGGVAVPTLTTINVSLSSSTIGVGQTVTATASGLDQYGGPIALSGVTWSAGSPGIAAVTQTGSITGVAVGSTTVIASSGGKQGQIAVTIGPAAVASVSIILGSPLVVGGTSQLTAVAKDASGNTISGRVFDWSSLLPLVANVSSTGLVSGRNVGSTTVTVRDQASLRSATLTVDVAAPSRPVGSILTIGVDSILQFDQWVYVSTLNYVDTAATGKDYRVGIAHTADKLLDGTVYRAQMPSLTAVAECPSGEVYAVNSHSINNYVQLWRVDSRTGYVTLLGDIGTNGIPETLVGLSCDSSNSLVAGGNFGGLGTLYRIDRTTRSPSGIRGYNESFLGLAPSATGTIYGTMNTQTGGTASGQLLVAINPTTGVATPVGTGQQRSLPLVHSLAFRGARLFGIAGGSRLVELNTATGSVTDRRAIVLP